MAKKQLAFDREVLMQKRFTIERSIGAKLDQLADKLHELEHSDIVWLSRIEDFFHKYEYLSKRQMEVLDSIVRKTANAS